LTSRESHDVDQGAIDLVEGVFIWGVPGLEVDSYVHEVRTFDRHLRACSKVLSPFAVGLHCVDLSHFFFFFFFVIRVFSGDGELAHRTTF
jgi:hypothetical protein